MRQPARLTGLALAIACLIVSGFGVTRAGAAVRVTVRPGIGGAHTRFELRFRNPAQTGTVAGVRRADRIVVSGPAGLGCLSSLTYVIRPAGAGDTIRVTLGPSRGSRWCAGRFVGRLIAYQSITCRPGPAQHACPLLLIAPRVLARFSFRVRASASSGGGGTAGAASLRRITRRWTSRFPTAPR